jgi:hypothetical protein
MEREIVEGYSGYQLAIPQLSSSGNTVLILSEQVKVANTTGDLCILDYFIDSSFETILKNYSL